MRLACRAAALGVLGARDLAKKAAPAKAAPAAVKKKVSADLDNVCAGLNIMKGGADPEIKPDSEYPDWVFELHKPKPTLAELQARYERDPDSMSVEDQRLLIRQWNRQRIKENNEKQAM